MTSDTATLALRTVLENLSSPGAKRTYVTDWDRFTRWLATKGIGPLEVTPKVVREHVMWMKDDQKLARSTINKAIYVIREVYRALVNDEVLEFNPARETKRPKMDRTLKTPVLNEEQVQQLLDAQPDKTWRERRDLLVLKALFGLGWRRSEIAAMRGDHFDEKDENVQARVKGDKLIYVAVPKWLRLSFKAWKHYAGIEDGPLFPWSPDELDKPITDNVVYNLVKAAAERAGFPDDAVTPHALRRSNITIAGKKGVSLKARQLAVGHATQSTTERYDHERDATKVAPGDAFADMVQGKARRRKKKEEEERDG